MTLINTAKTAPLALILVLLCGTSSGGEETHDRVALGPWQVGDKWVVQTNSREGGIRPDLEAEDFDSLQREWESDGKPKSIPFDEWLEKREPAAPTVVQDTTPGPAAESPYDPWMRDDSPPEKEHGPYSKEWVSWTFEVTAVELVAGRKCFCVKAMRSLADDSAKGTADTIHVDENGELVFPRRRLNSYYHVYYFDVEDRSLVRIEMRHLEGNKACERQQEFKGGEPVHASFDSSVAPPAYFPVVALGDYDPNKPKDHADSNRPVPAGIISQKLQVLADKRLMVAMAEDANVLSDVKGTKWAYAKFFFERDLPWWTEGYVHVLGGIRARLYSVNGKPLERKNLGVGGSKEQ
jgi:hypothetical protein